MCNSLYTSLAPCTYFPVFKQILRVIMGSSEFPSLLVFFFLIIWADKKSVRHFVRLRISDNKTQFKHNDWLVTAVDQQTMIHERGALRERTIPGIVDQSAANSCAQKGQGITSDAKVCGGRRKSKMVCKKKRRKGKNKNKDLPVI